MISAPLCASNGLPCRSWMKTESLLRAFRNRVLQIFYLNDDGDRRSSGKREDFEFFLRKQTVCGPS